MLKIKIHSFVDLITNSSTTVFMYQNDVNAVKELIQEIFNFAGVQEKPDDVFYFGVFHDDDCYMNVLDNLTEPPEGYPEITAKWNTPERKKQEEIKDTWFNKLKLSIMKGEIKEPEWMITAGESDWRPDSSTYIEIEPKDPDNKNAKKLARTIQKVLNSVDAEGFYDG